MLKLFGCPKDNSPEVELEDNTFLVDGYHFGDRLLEGVMFEVTFNDKLITKLEVEAASASYLKDLNEKKWLKAAKQEAQSILDQGGDEVDVPIAIKSKYPQFGAYAIYDNS